MYCTLKCLTISLAMLSNQALAKKISLKMYSIYGLRLDLTLLSILHVSLTGNLTDNRWL